MPHDHPTDYTISKRRLNAIAEAYRDRDAREYALQHIRTGIDPGDVILYQEGVEILNQEDDRLEQLAREAESEEHAEQEDPLQLARRFLTDCVNQGIRVGNKFAQPQAKLEFLRAYFGNDKYNKQWDGFQPIDTGREFTRVYRQMCRIAGQEPEF